VRRRFWEVFRIECFSVHSEVWSQSCWEEAERLQIYTDDGFRSIWHNWMVKALDRELLSERFQERDIRKKTASDVELEDAQ